jgi:hypothetical protein
MEKVLVRDVPYSSETLLTAIKMLEILLPGVLAVIAYTDNNGLGPDGLAVRPFRIFRATFRTI